MKTKMLFLISIAVLLLFVTSASADIMSPGMKSINRCVKIDNLDEFPDIVIVGYIAGPVIQIENPYIIQSNTCLTQYYKANNLTIYAVDREYFEKVGIENINFTSEIYVKAYEMETNPDSRTVSMANPLQKEEIYYSIAGFTDEGLELYESKIISGYVGGISKVEYFEQPETPDVRLTINDTSLLLNNTQNESLDIEHEKTNESLMESLIFFFNRLFGTA